MPTTGYDYSTTKQLVIESALRKVGALAHGETPTAEQVANAGYVLNEIVKELQSEHIFLWSLVQDTQALSATVASYSFSAKDYIWIDRAFIRENNQDEELRIISYREYFSDVTNKTDPGKPHTLAFDNARAPTIYLYPVPSTTYTLYYLGVKLLADFDAAGDVPDVHSRWFNTLAYLLAANLADDFGLPISERQWLEQKAEKFKATAKKGDKDHTTDEFVRGAY